MNRTAAGAFGVLAVVILRGAVVAQTGDGAVVPDERPRVAVFTPHGEDDTFWGLFTGCMQAAADDVGLVLEIRYAHDSRERMKEQIREACRGPRRVDAVVFQNFKQAGPQYLQIAEAAQVPALLVNAGLTDEQRREFGGPRERFRYWIGEILPDDCGAGAQLVDTLVDRARGRPASPDADGRLHAIALTGVVSDGASIERLAGLRVAAADHADLLFHQVVAANWRRDSAALRARVLLNRYPYATVIWAANDPMALGAIDAVRGMGLAPGVDVIIGGVDWTADALDAIDDGSLACSIGGHFLEGAWAAILLSDYLRGVDFSDLGFEFRSAMTPVTRETVAEYRALIQPETWRRYDFSRLSRASNPGQTAYRFEAGALLGSKSRGSEPADETASDVAADAPG